MADDLVAALPNLLDGDGLEQALAEARRHRISGRWLRRLDEASDALPAAIAAHVRSLRDGQRRALALIDMQRDALVSRLTDAGIRFVLLKGSALADTDYVCREDRQFGDVDLLVDRADLGRTREALEATGYRAAHDDAGMEAYTRHHFHLQFAREGSLMVEVHWALTRPTDVAWLDPAAVLADAREARPSAGTPFQIASPEHALLSIVLQHVSEGFSRLCRITDVDAILRAHPDVDAEGLVATATRGQLAPSLALALQLSHRIAGTPLPDGVVEAALPDARARAALAALDPVAFVVSRRGERANDFRLLTFWLQPGRRARRRWLADTLLQRHADPLAELWEPEAAPRTRGAPRRLIEALKFGITQARHPAVPSSRDRFW